MLRHRRKTHRLEQAIKLVRFGMTELDELEAVGAHRVVVGYLRRRGVVRKRSHGGSPFDINCGLED
jgi:hypothetical protein